MQIKVEAYHSRSARPIRPTLIPLDDSNIKVFGAPARATSSPSAGSKTFASSHGKLHFSLKCLNWVIPKSRSWFYSDIYQQLFDAERLAIGNRIWVRYLHLHKLRPFLVGLKLEPYDYLSSRNFQDSDCRHHQRRRSITWADLHIRSLNDIGWSHIETLQLLQPAPQSQTF